MPFVHAALCVAKPSARYSKHASAFRSHSGPHPWAFASLYLLSVTSASMLTCRQPPQCREVLQPGDPLQPHHCSGQSCCYHLLSCRRRSRCHASTWSCGILPPPAPQFCCSPAAFRTLQPSCIASTVQSMLTCSLPLTLKQACLVRARDTHFAAMTIRQDHGLGAAYSRGRSCGRQP